MRIKTTITGIAFASAGLLAACMQQQATEPAITAEATDAAPAPVKEVKLGPEISTIKPGASVTFSHEAPGKLDVGDTGSVTLTVHEGYPSGTLHLQASGDTGLSVFGAEASTRRDMTDVTSHTWRIDFAAEADGVHYLNILARIEMAEGFQESRAYAVRVEVGDWQTAQAKVQAATALEMQADGERAVIMEAEETINPE